VSEVRVREAYPRDVPVLIEFNQALARETEEKELEAERLGAGIRAIFEDPSRGTYFLAVRGDEAVGTLLVTPEWSDWRNGCFWWIQSVYVASTARHEGVFRRLYDHVMERARSARDVCGVRLYVARGNDVAQAVYERVGLRPSGYRMLETDFVLGAPSASGSPGAPGDEAADGRSDGGAGENEAPAPT